MPFKPGDPNINRKGRTPGIPNNYTKKAKEAFAMLLDDNLDNLSIWLSQVASEDPKEALKIVMALSERFIPKLSSQALTDADGENLLKGLTFKFGQPIDDDSDGTETN